MSTDRGHGRARGRFAPAPGTWRRPMRGWWTRNPRFLRYMLREASALFLVGYALVLLVGLWRLAQGEAAFAAWRAALETPLSIALHALAVAFVGYHAVTWFRVMPKTAPDLPLAPKWITRAGATASIALSAALFAAIWWATR